MKVAETLNNIWWKECMRQNIVIGFEGWLSLYNIWLLQNFFTVAECFFVLLIQYSLTLKQVLNKSVLHAAIT